MPDGTLIRRLALLRKTHVQSVNPNQTSQRSIRFSQKTGLGRPIDLTYQSNRWAVAGSALAGTANGFYHLIATGQIRILDSVLVGIAIFLTWAITRELDPDRPASATLAMVIVFPVMVIAEPSPGFAAVALLGVRVIAGTVGLRLSSIDRVVLVAAGAYAGVEPQAWPLAMLIVGGLLIDGSIAGRWAAVAAVVGAVTAALATGAQAQPSFDPAWALSTGLVVLILIAILPVRTVTSSCDQDAALITPERVTLARLGLALALVAGLALTGSSLVSLVPMAGALLATGVVHLVNFETRELVRSQSV